MSDLENAVKAYREKLEVHTALRQRRYGFQTALQTAEEEEQRAEKELRDVYSAMMAVVGEYPSLVF